LTDFVVAVREIALIVVVGKMGQLLVHLKKMAIVHSTY
jgi:hypothetical protein